MVAAGRAADHLWLVADALHPFDPDDEGQRAALRWLVQHARDPLDDALRAAACNA